MGAAAVTGVLTGLAVAGFETLTGHVLLDRVLRAPLAAQAVAPVLGLLLAALALKLLAGGASPSTADQYVANFHDRPHWLDTKPLPGRIVASVATLGLGGAMGFEGPSIYLGAAVGSTLQHRLSRFLRDETKALLVAGAAGGVAAIFKAPATGVLFALEVPYQDDSPGAADPRARGRGRELPHLRRPHRHQAAPRAGAGRRPVRLAELVAALVLGLVAGRGALGHGVDPAPCEGRLPACRSGCAWSWPEAAWPSWSWCRTTCRRDLASVPATARSGGWPSPSRRGAILALFVIRSWPPRSRCSAVGRAVCSSPSSSGAVLGRLLAGAPLAGPPAGHSTRPLRGALGVAAFLGAGYRGRSPA